MSQKKYQQPKSNRNLPEASYDFEVPTDRTKEADKVSAEAAKFLEDVDDLLANSPVLTASDLAKLEERDLSPVDSFYKDTMGTPASSASLASTKATSFIPTLGRPEKKPKAEDDSDERMPLGSGLATNSEAKSMNRIINEEKELRQKDIDDRIHHLKNEKISRFNVRGRARRKVRIIALSVLTSAVAAIPLGVMGLMPHAIQSWIENRASQFVQQATDKIGQRLIFSFFRDRVAIEKCKGYYNSSINANKILSSEGGVAACRPRMGESQGRIKQLFDDWQGAKMEDLLAKNGVEISYNTNPADGGNRDKPFKLTIGKDRDGNPIDFRDLSESEFLKLDFTETTDFMGRRESSKVFSRAIKDTLRKETRMWQFLKRRNMKAGFLRNLDLPSRFYGPDSLARKLDEREVKKKNRHTRWRQYVTKHVVNVGNGRVGALLEILFNGKSKDGTAKDFINENKILRQAAAKLGEEEVAKLVDKFAGKSLRQINEQIFKDIMSKLLGKVGEKIASTTTKAIPIVGWVLFAFTVLDMVDMATDGTLQKWISVMNSQSMMDAANLMDTTVSEEKKGFVDLSSSGDLRLMLMSGLSSSKLFANTVGYKSPDNAAGYDCKPNVSFNDLSGLFEASSEAFSGGDPSSLPQVGMSKDKKTCENHRVDYDPLAAFSGLFDSIQQGLKLYTDTCFLRLSFGPGGLLPPEFPGEEHCPSYQEIYHKGEDGISWIFDKLSFLTDWIAELPPIKALMDNMLGWMTSMVTILITGQSLTGPETLQGGLKTEAKSGAKLYDAWLGGQEVIQNSFAEGSGEGGGLGLPAMSGAQASEINDTIAQERKEELASASFFDRMFDVSHADTLASGVLAYATTQGGFSNFVNPFNNVASIMNSNNASAYAEGDERTRPCSEVNSLGLATTDFGIICNGISGSTIDNMTDQELEQYGSEEFCSTHSGEIDEEMSQIESDGDQGAVKSDGTPIRTKFDGCRLICTVTDGAGTMFRKDDKICGFEDLDSSSTGSSGGSVTPGEISDDSTDVECYPGTELVGVREDAFSQGKPIRINLCSVSNIPCGNEECQALGGGKALVSSVFSEAWFKLAEAAKAKNIPITATSSWRTMEHQQRLCNDDANCRDGEYNAVAQPGHSNHQTGAAIDISEAGFGQGAARGRTCETAQTVDSPTYNWLRDNAKNFGIKQYRNESWHWGGLESCAF